MLATILSVYHWWPQIDAIPYTAELDGRYVMHQLEVAKAALRQYHELPLWNPYDCRGIPMWDHPEAITASPLVLLATRLTATETLALWNVFHCAVGFLGMWLFARKELELERLGAFTAASMWAFGVSHTSQYAGAHSTLVCFWFAPLMLLLWRRAETDLRLAVALGGVVAFMLYEGATYPLPFCVLVVGLETVCRVWPPRRLPRVILAGVVTGVVAVGLSAARLLPLLAQMASKKRDQMDLDTDSLLSLFSLRKMFLWRESHWSSRLPDQQYVWGEYIAYVGGLALVLAAVGLVLSARRHWWFLVVGGMTFALMLGHFARYAPWSVLQHKVFPFKSMRVPSRFRLVFHLFLAGWVGFAVDRLAPTVGKVLRRHARFAEALGVVAVGAALLGAGDAMGLGKEIIGVMHQGPPEKTVVRSPRFYYEGGGLADFLDQPRQNRAWLGCRSYEWPSHRYAPVWSGDVPQARAFDPGVTVLAASRTVNTFRVEVEATQPGRVLLNSAHADGWVSDVGTITEEAEMLTVSVPAGRSTVRLKYRPKGLVKGAWISGITLGVALIALLVGGRRRWIVGRD
ncbi:MAG: hypothetical protein JNL79_11165 [Myxococcales bacterium]|nr:hypothetical protein [Myxococcales bacterium]